MAIYLMKRSGPSGPLVVGSLLAKTTVCNHRPNSKVDVLKGAGWVLRSYQTFSLQAEKTSSGHQSIGLRMLRVTAGIVAHLCTFGLTVNGTIRLLWVLRNVQTTVAQHNTYSGVVFVVSHESLLAKLADSVRDEFRKTTSQLSTSLTMTKDRRKQSFTRCPELVPKRDALCLARVPCSRMQFHAFSTTTFISDLER
eukprot:5496410-Pleurochrysis_carterae.AAC.1